MANNSYLSSLSPLQKELVQKALGQATSNTSVSSILSQIARQYGYTDMSKLYADIANGKLLNKIKSKSTNKTKKTEETQTANPPTESTTNYVDVYADPSIKAPFSAKKPESYTDLEYAKMKEYGKQIAEQKDLQLEREKEITDNYLPIREELAQSLRDGTYFDANTDPRAIEYRNEYTRGAKKAMDDTIANLAGRTGGLASSYAGAVGQNKYNSMMDELAGKILDLRTLAEQSVRNSLNDYNNLESLNRSLQSANNNVIGNNNSYAKGEYDALRNRLQDAYNAYEHASQMGYGRFQDELADFYNKWNMYLQDRQQGEAERQFDEDLAFKYAQLEAQQAQQGSSGGVKVASGGGGTGKVSSGGGGGGVAGTDVTYTPTGKQAPNVGQTRDLTIGEWASQQKTDDALKKYKS